MSVDSDYLLRGVSLSDGQPVLSASLAYDARSGLYGGVTAIAVATRHAGAEMQGYVANIGYARRLASGLSWDVGVSNSQVSTYGGYRYDANYTEIYAGLAKGGISAHLYVSPDYLGEHARTVYLEADGAVRPARDWRLSAHAGLLTVVDGPIEPLGGRTHADFRVGVARTFGQFEARLAASVATPRPVYPEGVRRRSAAVTLGASYFF